MGKLSGKKILMIVSSSEYRDEELDLPSAVLSSFGAEIKIASSSMGPARGKLGGSVQPDMLISDIKPDEFDAIVFVGGNGSSEYWDNKDCHRIAVKAFRQNKVIAAICIAPVTLARAGLLKGVKATCYPEAKKELSDEGAVYTGAGVEKSGNIITANGPGSAKRFGQIIAEELSD